MTSKVAEEAGIRAIEAGSRNTEGSADPTPAIDRLELAGELATRVTLWYRWGGEPVGPWTRYGVDEDPPWSWTFDTSGTGGDGPYEFYSLAAGVAGTSESKAPLAEASTVADATAPEFTSTAPSGVLTESGVLVSWNATDATSGIAGYEVSVDGGRFAPIERRTDLHLIVADGDHVVLVRAIDMAGNAAETEIRFRVDTNVFSSTGPYNGVPLYVSLAAAVASAAVVAFIFWRRRRRRTAAAARNGEERET